MEGLRKKKLNTVFLESTKSKPEKKKLRFNFMLRIGVKQEPQPTVVSQDSDTVAKIK